MVDQLLLQRREGNDVSASSMAAELRMIKLRKLIILQFCQFGNWISHDLLFNQCLMLHALLYKQKFNKGIRTCDPVVKHQRMCVNELHLVDGAEETPVKAGEGDGHIPRVQAEESSTSVSQFSTVHQRLLGGTEKASHCWLCVTGSRGFREQIQK